LALAGLEVLSNVQDNIVSVLAASADATVWGPGLLS